MKERKKPMDLKEARAQLEEVDAEMADLFARRMEAVRDDAIDARPRLEFLSPLDPMLWDRKLVEALWDYHYKWEIYTPADQRKFGYFVLPVLWGDRLVGRIEAAAERRTGTLVVKHIWYEDGVRRTKKLAAAVEGAVRRLAKFNDCGLVEYR